MKSGEIIYAKTNAELLNALLNKNYKQWYKCTYDLNTDIFIWMVRLDNTNTAGRRNQLKTDYTIVEQFDKYFPKNERFYHGLNIKQRLVFEKIKTKSGQIYKFHGLYRLDKVEDDEYKRTLKLQKDEYTF